MTLSTAKEALGGMIMREEERRDRSGTWVRALGVVKKDLASFFNHIDSRYSTEVLTTPSPDDLQLLLDEFFSGHDFTDVCEAANVPHPYELIVVHPEQVFEEAHRVLSATAKINLLRRGMDLNVQIGDAETGMLELYVQLPTDTEEEPIHIFCIDRRQ